MGIPGELDGERVRTLRKALNLTQVELAEAVTKLGGKLSQQQLVAIEKSIPGRSRSQRELAIALGTSEDYLLKLTDDEKPVTHTFSAENRLRIGAVPRNLDVWRVSPGGGMYEWVLTKDPIDAVSALDGLEAAKDAFALRIPDDAIAPAYEKNDTAFVDLSVEALPGQHCVICREIPGRVKSFAFVARKLISSTALVWKVRQYKPPHDYDISRKEWPLAIKLQGKRAR